MSKINFTNIVFFETNFKKFVDSVTERVEASFLRQRNCMIWVQLAPRSYCCVLDKAFCDNDLFMVALNKQQIYEERSQMSIGEPGIRSTSKWRPKEKRHRRFLVSRG